MKPVYLITGSDRPKIETAVARLRARFAAEAIELASAVDVTGDEAVALCNAGSLFGDARLIVVRDVDGAKQAEGRRKGGWKTADVEAVAAYLASPAPDTVLALVADELKSSSALWKACAKAGDVLSYGVEKKKLHEWVTAQFAQHQARAEPDAVSALIQLVGDDPAALKSEIDKLATWAGGEPFGEREVEALVAANADVPIYELTEAWAVRDASRALGVSETIFEHESRQRRDTAARLAGSLGGHLNRLRALKRLAAEGVSSKEAASQLKLNPYYASKLYRQAEGFSEDELDDAVLRLAELDGGLKGQSRLASDLEVQRALVDLTRRPGAANANGR
ncbi:MAG TPA: DNA polymerase III subunit delta [Gaiellaceae bacterium]|nr:DNA polymerase III subunit delta [Gaiellaceae bacterium]